jgi:hypothetical protein
VWLSRLSSEDASMPFTVTPGIAGRAIGAASVVAALILSGCDPVQAVHPQAFASALNAPGAPSTAPRGSQGQIPQFSVTVILTGAVSGSTHYAQKQNTLSLARTPTCEQLAQKGFSDTSPTFTTPGGDGKATINGFAIAVGYSISSYHGPGTYQLTGDNSSIPAGASVDQSSSQDPFGGEAASATINADGSGEFSFSGWKDSTDRSEAADVTWTCLMVAQ